MKVFGKSSRKKSILPRLALLALAVYIVVMFIQLSAQIADGQAQLDALGEQMAAAQHVNEDLQYRLENPDVYLEQQAREQGLARPGETIVVEVPGI